MEKKELLYEGKAKRVYQTELSDRYIVSYKDDATAFNGLKKGSISGKGIINNKMSNLLFQYLEKNGVETHFIEEINERESIVKKVSIVPLEVIVRNVAAGSFALKYGIEEGIILKNPVLEYSYKNDALQDPMINDLQITAIGLASNQELASISESALKINSLLQAYFIKKGIKLIDFKIEFGRYENRIILADEISPDTCRLWDMVTNEKLDKDRFRRDLGGIVEAYEEVWKRITTD